MLSPYQQTSNKQNHDIKDDTRTKYFISLCEYGNESDISEFYFKYAESLDARSDHDLPFRTACNSGNLEVAMWIYHNFSPDLSTFNHEAFFFSCMANEIEIASWLSSIDNNYIYE